MTGVIFIDRPGAPRMEVRVERVRNDRAHRAAVNMVAANWPRHAVATALSISRDHLDDALVRCDPRRPWVLAFGVAGNE